MSWRDEFNGKFEQEWIDVNTALPLDEYRTEGEWGIVDYVLVLINDEEDPNDDPSIVMLEVLLDHDKTFSWNFIGGGAYHECHAKNIKYWCDIPNYTKQSVMGYKNDKRNEIGNI